MTLSLLSGSLALSVAVAGKREEDILSKGDGSRDR
jgi:hypothetical protein